MKIIFVCHTEFGLVKNQKVIADKSATDGVLKGVPNIIKIIDRYNAKASFAVMPEVLDYFPKEIGHEVGLHIHPGWQESEINGVKFQVGDIYLREHCSQSSNSTILKDYCYEEQLDMIRTGKDHLKDKLNANPLFFVAGRWSIDNSTIKALDKSGFAYECSAVPHSKPCHHDWSRLQRICMPYHPSKNDYQSEGDMNLLIVPISQMLLGGNVNPEVEPYVGINWMKSCFLEYYKQGLPLFHICLHSPAATDLYFLRILDDLIKFISQYNVEFSWVSEIKETYICKPRPLYFEYLRGINKKIIRHMGASLINVF